MISDLQKESFLSLHRVQSSYDVRYCFCFLCFVFLCFDFIHACIIVFVLTLVLCFVDSCMCVFVVVYTF